MLADKLFDKVTKTRQIIRRPDVYNKRSYYQL